MSISFAFSYGKVSVSGYFICNLFGVVLMISVTCLLMNHQFNFFFSWVSLGGVFSMNLCYIGYNACIILCSLVQHEMIN